MSLDESFRYIPKYREDEVFELTGKANEVRILEPSNFEGPMLKWATQREQQFGDLVLSRVVYKEVLFNNPHRVAWVYHENLDFESGEHNKGHHILCDCIVEAEIEDDIDLMFKCSALQTVLEKRAWLISNKFRMSEIFGAYSDEEVDDFEQNPYARELALRTIAYLLEYDQLHPEGWVANVVSGQHHASLLALIMQQPPEIVRWYAEMLESTGEIEFDGETLRLPAGGD